LITYYRLWSSLAEEVFDSFAADCLSYPSFMDYSNSAIFAVSFLIIPLA